MPDMPLTTDIGVCLLGHSGGTGVTVKRGQAVSVSPRGGSVTRADDNDARETARQACHRVTLLPCAIVARWHGGTV